MRPFTARHARRPLQLLVAAPSFLHVASRSHAAAGGSGTANSGSPVGADAFSAEFWGEATAVPAPLTHEGSIGDASSSSDAGAGTATHAAASHGLSSTHGGAGAADSAELWNATGMAQQHGEHQRDQNVVEVEDAGLIYAAEALCDDLLTCKTDVLKHFARSRGSKSVAKANMVSELIEIASKTFTNPTHRSVARRILGNDIELPKREGVRSAWTNESLEASMLEAAAVKKAQFALHNYAASLRATSVRVSPMSQRLLRAIQDDFGSVSHTAVKGVHREYVESAKQILERHTNVLSSLVAVFSTIMTHSVEHSEVLDYISAADIPSRAVYLGLARPTIENEAAGPTATLDPLMSMLDDVVAEVTMRQGILRQNPRFHNGETRETFRRSVASFKQRQLALKRDAVAVRRALADVPPWVVEMARQFEVWETLVRSDIEDLRRAPAEIFDLILANVAASVASDELHGDEQSRNGGGSGGGGNNSSGSGGGAAGGGGGGGGLGGSGTGGGISFAGDASAGGPSGNAVPGYMRQALRDAIIDYADEGLADTIVLKLNAYAAGKSADAASARPVLRPTLFKSIHVMMHGMVTDEVTEPPFERVAVILKEFTRTIHRSERIASVFQLLVQLTESMHFHLRFAAVFPKLSEKDRGLVRSGSRTLESPLENFEAQLNVTPLPVSGVAFFSILMVYFCIRSSGSVISALPIASRLESTTGIDELAILTLTSLRPHSVRSLPLSHPPRMTYTSWIDDGAAVAGGAAAATAGTGGGAGGASASASASAASTPPPPQVQRDSASVYRLLPSDAVKSSTSNLMLTSRAPIIRALDAISRVPWRINKMMLYVQEAILQEGYAFGKVRASFYPLAYARMQNGEITVASPYESNTSLSSSSSTPALAPAGGGSSVADASAAAAAAAGVANNNNNNNKTRKLYSHRLYRKYVEEQNRDWRELLDTRSPRVHHIQALRQARALVNVARVYFPNNMDFRGRMYPMPGRLNHTGSDPFRASLEFADPKPLGPDGVYWLKVHVANKMGQTKMSFNDRKRWVDEHINDVVQSAESPLSGDRWWQEGDEPFQALTACMELADALKCSQGTENFLSRLPVAVDGSYNGLQHYSAIGRDEAGGALVNLVPQKLPSDAYTGILKEMMKSIITDAAKDHAVAQRCIGTGRGMDKNHVRRKTIKQSIMTQVYGVTDYGMGEQIHTQLINQNKAHGLWTTAEMQEMASYLRDKVNESLGVTFRQTQECRSWLAEVSTLIWKCQPAELRNAFSWTTPLGLIVRQPYRKGIETSVFTPVGYSRIKGSPLEPASPKQLTALAPNLVHSLDATHLAMTALEMQRRGLMMMAVHDSFWTYACDLPVLSRVLREQFLELYTNFDPLVELKQQWEELFFMDLRRHGVVLPDPPKRGTLNLELVLQSEYFFS